MKEIFARLLAWLREAAIRPAPPPECFVASAVFTSSYTEDGRPTGEQCAHIVEFFEGADGRRATVDTADDTAAGRHDGLRLALHGWERFGALPPHALRAQAKPAAPPNLIVFPGGKP